MDKEHMERKQVYISANLTERLERYAALHGRNASEVIRAALEDYLFEHEEWQKKDDARFLAVLDQAFGMWKDRDPKEFEATRRSLDRPLWNK